MRTDETGRARAAGLTVCTPCVGCDADGVRRSARIDRGEADTGCGLFAWVQSQPRVTWFWC